MASLEHALSLARKGFHVFPLIQGQKLPAIEGFPERATADEDQIRRWWLCPVMGFDQGYNVGISTTHFGAGALLVVDVDNKDGKCGSDAVLKLELEGFDLPPTFTQLTPTGGFHFVYRVPTAVKQSAGMLAPGLDIRSRGGFIVGAGSDIEKGSYSIRDEQSIADAPQWLIERCGYAEITQAPTQSPLEATSHSAERRAIEYLNHNAPLAVEGAAGDQTTYQVACRLKDFGVTRSDALALLDLYWNERCSPPWGWAELEQKVNNAYRYGKEASGALAPETAFEPVQPEKEISYLEKINEEFALIYIEGSHFILQERVDERGRPHRVFLSELSFRRKFSPYTVNYGKKTVTYAEAWLDWPHRREYAGLCFAPGREPRHGYYNLWRGFTCPATPYAVASPAAQRGFDLFMEHISQNVCGANEKIQTWLMGWFAHMIQRPYERPLTTLVFRGGKGVGKNAPIDRVGRLLGRGHYLVAHDGRYLTSNFNGHLDSCLCLVLDEAFWSGDKAAEGKLKGLTTSTEILIERKGKEPYQVDNLVRLVVIGNEEWLVPASPDERRYAVFDVGIGRKQDRAFFTEMRVLMDEQGGNEVLLDYLMNFDLSTTDIDDIPRTLGLFDQKAASLEPFHQWWFDCLLDGALIGSDFGGDWPREIDKERLRSAFRRYARDRNIKGRIPDDRFLGRELKKCLPAAETHQKRREGAATVNVYRLPELQVCRQQWDTFMMHDTQW